MTQLHFGRGMGPVTAKKVSLTKNPDILPVKLRSFIGKANGLLQVLDLDLPKTLIGAPEELQPRTAAFFIRV